MATNYHQPGHAPSRSVSRSPSPDGYPASPLVPQPHESAKHPGVAVEMTDVRPDAPGQPSHQSNAALDFFANTWACEIAACVASCLFLIGLAMFLHSVDGQPLTQVMWGLFPNTIVSILSTAVKATLLLPIGECISQLKWVHARHTKQPLYSLQRYDSASRGPLGAANFLCTKPSMLHATAYLCCLVTIISLALDPFSQQILYYMPGTVPRPGLKGALPVSHTFDLAQQGLLGTSVGIGAQRDADSQAAIVSGLLGHPGTMPFVCPGNECVFRPTTGLAIVGSCTDVTRDIKTTCYHPGLSDGLSSWHNASTQTCDLQFPNNGSTLSAAVIFDAHSGTQHTTLNMTAVSSPDMCDPLEDARCTPQQLTAAHILRFPFDDNSAGPSDTKWLESMNAHTCTLELRATGNMGVRATNGTLRIMDEATAPLIYAGKVSSPSGPLLDQFQVHEVVAWPHNVNYSMNVYDLANISNLLGRLFSPATAANADVAGQLLNNAITHTPDLDAMFAAVGAAMSIRLATGPNSTAIPGLVLADETIVHVQWGWLSLTVILVAATLAIQTATVLDSRRHARDTLWKSSVLPLAVIPQAWPRDEAPAQRWRLSDLEARARQLQVEAEVAGASMTWRLS